MLSASKKLVCSLVLVSTAVFSQSASASLEYYQAINKFEGRRVVSMFGEIDSDDSLVPLDTSVSTILIISSNGGSTSGTRRLIRQIRSTASQFYHEGRATLEIGFAGECSSACLSLVAATNQLAAQGWITASVDSNVKLRFHGAYIGGFRSEWHTQQFQEELIGLGVDADWIDEHPYLFSQRTLDQGLVPVPVTHPTLRRAHFVDHMKLRPSKQLVQVSIHNVIHGKRLQR